MVSQLETPLSDLSRQLPISIEGLVQVFTCPHRSFFTNVIAQALRIAGQGTPVLVVQFLKGGIRQGHEHPMQMGQHLDWYRCNLPRCIDTPQLEDAEKQSVLDLWEHTKAQVAAGRYHLVVLEDLSLAINFGLIPEADVLEFLATRPAQVDVILTGPEMPASILEIADQITELRRSHNP
ncbi:MAG: P-loop NTPase family protein [Kaiparowitsia implicata GSE-PSE-MK54-09C]|jgi:cob(I)alamin adenosyltransferase|nr:P-loop NTPase family protein [Kaiparowitsia implicata GSE-PSE-MK54-09C]